MLGINNQHIRYWYQRTYPWVLRLQYQSDIEIWWVSHCERIFVDLSYKLGQYLNHIETREIVPRYKGSCMVF